MSRVFQRVTMFPPDTGGLPSSNSTEVLRSSSALSPWSAQLKMAPCRQYAFCESLPRSVAFILCRLRVYRPPSPRTGTRARLYCEITNCAYPPASPSCAYPCTPSSIAHRSTSHHSHVLVISGVFDVDNCSQEPETKNYHISDLQHSHVMEYQSHSAFTAAIEFARSVMRMRCCCFGILLV
jgi:hypothetical protein